MSSDRTVSPPTRGLTRHLAEGLGAYRFAGLPEAVRTVARHCLLDWLGVAIAGSREPVSTILADELCLDSTVEAAPGGCTVSGCTVIGTASSASPHDAAAVNGTAGHALDFDDVLTPMSGHPSAPVIPAALALAERMDAGGDAFLAAVVAGIETEARIGMAVAPGHYDAGFHATGTVGAFGAAAACASLLDLGADRASAALGIAGTQAAGLKSQFGTMCKPLHAGKAAANGLLAATLAARGFTSAPDVLERAQGFAATQTTTFDPEAGMDPPGRPWRIREVLFKVHAACFFTHASIEALLAMHREVGLRPSEVDSVTLRVPIGHLAACDIAAPATPLEGKFSLRFTSALALVRGTAGEADFTAAAVRDPELVAVRDRVRVIPVADLSPHVSQVEVALADGRRLAREVDMERPAGDDDLADQERRLAGKFRTLVAPILGAGRADELVEAVGRVTGGGPEGQGGGKDGGKDTALRSVRELAALCRTERRVVRPGTTGARERSASVPDRG